MSICVDRGKMDCEGFARLLSGIKYKMGGDDITNKAIDILIEETADLYGADRPSYKEYVYSLPKQDE